MMTPTPPDLTAQSAALRRLLATGLPQSALADFMYLEAWERHPAPGVAAARRVAQIRRAYPDLAAAIRREVGGRDEGH